ncbi:MAG: RNA polymerase sigma factor [Polyangiaceae bacterium]
MFSRSRHPTPQMASRSAPAGRQRLWVVPHDATAQPRLPAPTLDDSELLASIRRGDPDAATALHDRLRPVAERSVRRLLGASDRDREDLVQQAMIEVVTTVDRFRGECPLDAWASSVAAHVVYKHIRRRVTERKIFEHLGGADDALATPADSGARAAARSALRRVVTHLEAIDPAKAWAYVLHDVCGYDLREVAQITESTVAAAQSRLVRGRRELRDRLLADPELSTRMKGGPS